MRGNRGTMVRRLAVMVGLVLIALVGTVERVRAGIIQDNTPAGLTKRAAAVVEGTVEAVQHTDRPLPGQLMRMFQIRIQVTAVPKGSAIPVNQPLTIVASRPRVTVRLDNLAPRPNPIVGIGCAAVSMNDQPVKIPVVGDKVRIYLQPDYEDASTMRAFSLESLTEHPGDEEQMKLYEVGYDASGLAYAWADEDQLSPQQVAILGLVMGLVLLLVGIVVGRNVERFRGRG
ncbi:hypothetical protein [Tuwongella immobilis]|uniref:Uncharacterized protein n=1 Tax=Tuwongella immobilis TaxID=692036 RepID=A0A6C2YHW7_9BACT|nr:hypothetical protein [Tuwongella immobilis]VIP00859.1 unnamed protein product [Tuwongella immobilis]VTR97136.1 unnamed protein product [Tuwongella immobilis]